VLGEPLVVFWGRLRDVLHVVEAARLHGIPVVRVVDLDLEALLREPGLLVLSENVHAAVRIGCGLHVNLELEIPEHVIAELSVVVDVPRRAVRHDGAILDGPRCGIDDLPAGQVLSVEEARPPGFGWRSRLKHESKQQWGDAQKGAHNGPECSRPSLFLASRPSHSGLLKMASSSRTATGPGMPF
jgi:hypothetical protein